MKCIDIFCARVLSNVFTLNIHVFQNNNTDLENYFSFCFLSNLKTIYVHTSLSDMRKREIQNTSFMLTIRRTIKCCYLEGRNPSIDGCITKIRIRFTKSFFYLTNTSCHKHKSFLVSSLACRTGFDGALATHRLLAFCAPICGAIFVAISSSASFALTWLWFIPNNIVTAVFYFF